MEVAQHTAVFEMGPSAPPPSPSLGSKRRHGIISISTLLGRCCEELQDKNDSMEVEINNSGLSNLSTHVPVKRQKTEVTVPNFCSQFGGHFRSQETQCGPRPTSTFTGRYLVSSVNLNSFSIGSKA